MKDTPAVDHFISVPSTAEALGCTCQFVYKLIGTGELRAIKIGSRAIRISVTSLNVLISESWIDPSTYQTNSLEEPDGLPPEPQPPKRPAVQRVAKSNWMSK